MHPKILVVDDFPETLSIYAELFELQGHRVVTALNGSEAMERAQEHRLALVVIDDDPDGSSAVELSARLKRISLDERQMHVKTIAVRGDFLAGQEPWLVGFDYVFSKPLDFDRFDEAVRHCVSLHS